MQSLNNSTLLPENRLEQFRIRPAPIKLQNILRRAQLAPFLLKFIEALAAREAVLALILPQPLCFFRVELVALRIARDVINVSSRPLGYDFLLQVLQHLRGVALERVAITRPASAEAEQQIALFVKLRRARDQFKRPVAVHCFI